MAKSGVEYLAKHPGWRTSKRKPRDKVEHLDLSDVTTILAALRFFQKDAIQINEYENADAWPFYFSVRDEEVVPEPLGTSDIDALCERINCAKVLVLR